MIVALVVTLAGCGGGGSDQGPVAGDGETNPGGGESGGDGDNTDPDPTVSGEIPKSATAGFGDSANDAMQLTAFVSRAEVNLEDGGDNGGGNNGGDENEPGQPIQPDPGNDYDTFSLPTRQGNVIGGSSPRLKVFTTTQPCAFVFSEYELIESCTGNIPIETNFDEYGQVSRYPAGAYLAYSLDGVSIVTSDGRRVDLGGDYRFTVKGTESAQILPVYRGDFYLDTDNYIGLDEDGVVVGPVSGRQDATFHDDGTISLILRGARYRDYVFIRGENEQTYRVVSGSMIARYGSGYAQVEFIDWNVINGVPQEGSQVRVIGANQETASVKVVSVSPTEVEFALLVSAGSINRDFKVTATVTPEGLKL